MNKTLFLLFATIMSPAAVLFVGCSRNDNASTSADKAAANVHAAVSNSWDSIKDFTYEKRTEFSASMNRMAGQIDDKTRALKGKLAGVPAAASKDRDGAIKDYDDARSDLKSRLSDLGNATADTWADAKEKVAQSWKQVQAAYDKVVSSAGS